MLNYYWCMLSSGLTILKNKNNYQPDAAIFLSFDDRVPELNRNNYQEQLNIISNLDHYHLEKLDARFLSNQDKFWPYILGFVKRVKLNDDDLVRLCLFFARYRNFSFENLCPEAMEIYNDNSHLVIPILESNKITSQDTLIYRVIIDNRRWIFKWNLNINYEIENWKKVMSMGMKTPEILFGFKWWGYDVLVMEELQPLEKPIKLLNKENYRVKTCNNNSKFDVIRQISKDILRQLSTLHTFCCHSDIKPDNIMIKQIGTLSQYYLIDLEAISNIKKYYGYIRNSFTPNFTSQYSEYGVITTYKHDLIEFGYVLNWLYSSFENDLVAKLSNGENYLDVRNIYPDNPIYEYMEYVRKLDERNWDPIIYEKLTHIINESTIKFQNSCVSDDD